MTRAVIGLGSNLGSREAFLRGAIQLLRGLDEVRVTARSRLYETEPMGPPQPRFLNAAIAVETTLAPEDLLARLLAVEGHLGRVREVRWGPRTIDLDLLVVEGAEVRSPTLELPHPRLRERSFALAPLLDAAPWLAAIYAPALAALGPEPAPIARAWTDVVSATDDLDALALSVTARLGEGPARSASALVARDPISLVAAATAVPGAAGLVVERAGPGEIVARVLCAGAPQPRAGFEDPMAGTVVVIPGGPKVGLRARGS